MRCYAAARCIGERLRLYHSWSGAGWALRHGRQQPLTSQPMRMKAPRVSGAPCCCPTCPTPAPHRPQAWMSSRTWRARSGSTTTWWPPSAAAGRAGTSCARRASSRACQCRWAVDGGGEGQGGVVGSTCLLGGHWGAWHRGVGQGPANGNVRTRGVKIVRGWVGLSRAGYGVMSAPETPAGPAAPCRGAGH